MRAAIDSHCEINKWLVLTINVKFVAKYSFLETRSSDM